MRKTIIRRFIWMLMIAMITSGCFFYGIVSRAITKNTKANLRLNLTMLDNSLDYTLPLAEQIYSITTTIDQKMARYTIISSQGVVLADSSVVDNETLENHSDRIEVIEAVEHGIGYSARYSDTLKTSMMYMAERSKNPNYILRISIPFTGSNEYLILLLPGIAISIILTLLLAIVSAGKFTKSITQPLHDIAFIMENYQEDEMILDAVHTPYEELNSITESARRMSASVKKYTVGIEFERMVRQEFFANASHELKTPLTSIRGYTELLLGGMAKEEETREDFMKRILSETENMTNVINDILLISQLETKDYEVVLSDVRMSLLLSDVIATLKPTLSMYKVGLFTECKPVTVKANVQQMRELLLNLMGNAIKYNKTGGTVSVTISTDRTDLMIVIKDTGMGIPQEHQKRVFERFYRVDKGRSRRVSGTGLGLSIVKHIVNYYDGTIELISEVNEGSTFTIRLPELIV